MLSCIKINQIIGNVMQVVTIKPASVIQQDTIQTDKSVLVFPDDIFHALNLSSSASVQLTQHADGHIELNPIKNNTQTNNINKLKGMVKTSQTLSIEEMNDVIANAGASFD